MSKLPDIATFPGIIDDEVLADQLLRLMWFTSLGKKGWRRNDHPLRGAHLTRRHAGVGQRAQAKRYVNAIPEEVDVPVVEYEIDIQIRMLPKKRFEQGNHGQSGKSDRRTDTKAS